jgi:hypothetical protein
MNRSIKTLDYLVHILLISGLTKSIKTHQWQIKRYQRKNIILLVLEFVWKQILPCKASGILTTPLHQTPQLQHAF